jgi:hypothetical protein
LRKEERRLSSDYGIANYWSGCLIILPSSKPISPVTSSLETSIDYCDELEEGGLSGDVCDVSSVDSIDASVSSDASSDESESCDDDSDDEFPLPFFYLQSTLTLASLLSALCCPRCLHIGLSLFFLNK